MTTADIHDISTQHFLQDINLDVDTYIDALKISTRGPNVILQGDPKDVLINTCNHDILSLYYDVLGSEKVEQDHESEEEHVEKEWSKVKLSLQNAAKELLPKKVKKKKRGWMNDEILSKMEQRKNVKNKTTEYNVINKEIVDKCRQAKENWLNE